VSDPSRRALGVVIDYATTMDLAQREAPSSAQQHRRPFSAGSRIGFIGAGSFARRVLIPLATSHGLSLDRVATESGLSAVSVAEQFGFRRGACTVEELLGDDAISGVIVATRHDLHGSMALAALQAGKGVFVEKPLCLTEDELGLLRTEVKRDDAPPLMVGFNRRFAHLTRALRTHLEPAQGPTNVVVRVNAGSLPADHWLNDAATGGGRLIGEGCHFLDLIVFLTSSDPVAVNAQARHRANEPLQSAQDFSVSIRFADGSVGILLYGTAGAPDVGKELVEVHRDGRSGRIDDFRSLRLWGAGHRRRQRSRRRDKGHDEEMRLFAATLRGESAAPPVDGYLTSTHVAFAALRSLQNGGEVMLEADGAH
jgi:predicted dehydrogenase